MLKTSDDMMKADPNSIIRKKSLAEELAGRLRQQIAGGKFGLGEKLPAEPELMRIFGVGRSTVREAVKTLSNMGLLEVQQGAGTFVANLSASDEPLEQRLKRADIHDLDEVRKILEVAIAGKAAERRGRRDTDKIEKYLADRKTAAEAGALEECIEADVNFHVAVAEAAHNDILCELYRSAAVHLKRGFRHIYDDTSFFLASQPSHERLARSIAAGDAAEAVETVVKIVEEP